MGRKASSLLHSLAVTAHLNDVNLYNAFNVRFTEIPKSQTIENYERLATFILS
jgi:hypothetical protein